MEESAMETQVLLARPNVRSTKPPTLSHHPVRVFLLSDCRLLREAFVRVFKADSRVLLVGAKSFSTATATEVTESACEVLLTDHPNINALETKIVDQILDKLAVQIVILEHEAKIGDVLSSILKANEEGQNVKHLRQFRAIDEEARGKRGSRQRLHSGV
jgi:hypothetical protein